MELTDGIINSIKDCFIKEDIQISFHGDDFYLICDKK